MRKLSLVAAILLLSSAWVLAQSGSSPSSDQNPSSTSPSQTSPSQTSPSSTQPSSQQPSEGSQTSSASANTVEGCVGGSAGNYTLTDASGKTYQLSGDTSKLADHVGHQVRITGDEAGAGAAGGAASSGATGAAGGSNTITVKKVKMISSSCPSK